MSLRLGLLIATMVSVFVPQTWAGECDAKCWEENIRRVFIENSASLPHGQVKVDYKPLKNSVATFAYSNGRFIFVFDPKKFKNLNEVKQAVHHEMIHAWNAQAELSANPTADSSPPNRTGLSFIVFDQGRAIYGEDRSFPGHEILAWRSDYLFSQSLSESRLERGDLCNANIWLEKSVADLGQWQSLSNHADRIIDKVRPVTIFDYATHIVSPLTRYITSFDLLTRTTWVKEFGSVGSRSLLSGNSFFGRGRTTEIQTLEIVPVGLRMDYHNRSFPDPASSENRQRILDPFLEVMATPHSRPEVSRTVGLLSALHPQKNGQIGTHIAYQEKVLAANLNAKVEVPWGIDGIVMPKFTNKDEMANQYVQTLNQRFFAQCAPNQCAPASTSAYPMTIHYSEEVPGYPNVGSRKVNVWLRTKNGQVLGPTSISPMWPSPSKSLNGQQALLFPERGGLVAGEPVYVAPCLGLYF